MKKIKLKNSPEEVIVSEEDFERLNQFNWYRCPNGYARATINKKRWYMHSFLLKPNKGYVCDHIDGNRLNNTRENIRIATYRENSFNSKSKKNTSSKYKGVSYCSTENRKKKWVAAYEKDNKRHYIGRFETEEEARDAYRKAVEPMHKEFFREK